MIDVNPSDIVIDDLERIKEATESAYDAGCIAGAVALIRDLTADQAALRAALSFYADQEPESMEQFDAWDAVWRLIPQPDNSPSPVEDGAP